MAGAYSQNYDFFNEQLNARDPRRAAGNPNVAGPSTPVDQSPAPGGVHTGANSPASPTFGAPQAAPVIGANPWNGPINGGGASTPGGAATQAMGSGLDAILKQINSSYDAQTGLATQQAGKDWQRGMAARGLGRGDMASQDMNQKMLANAMAPLAAGRSNAISGAMLADQNSQVQNQQFQQSLDLRRQDMLQSNALSQQQFGLQQSSQQFQQQQATQQAQWAAEDRQRQLAAANLQAQVDQRNLQGQLNGGGVGAGPSGGSGGWRDPLTGSSTPFLGSQGVNPFASAPAGGSAGNAATAAMGGAPLGAGSLPGDTLNGGSTAGLNPDGSWRHPGSYSSNTGAPGGGRAEFSPNSTVGTTGGPSSAGANSQPAGYNTQAGQRGTNPASLTR